jgi:hypothetical protein
MQEDPEITPSQVGPDTITPDTKDWTWVLEQPCPECGFDSRAVAGPEIGDRVRVNAAVWQQVLGRADVTTRPAPGVWSPLEYACHVVDVHRVFEARAALMLAEDDPLFENWDQDATALADRYDLQDPQVVAVELTEAADSTADLFDSVADDQWDRSGRRSNGSEFTVLTLGQYGLHDLRHHLWDVGVDSP